MATVCPVAECAGVSGAAGLSIAGDGTADGWLDAGACAMNGGVGALGICGGIGVALVIVLSHASVDWRRSTAPDTSSDTRVSVPVVETLCISVNGCDATGGTDTPRIAANSRAAVALTAGDCAIWSDTAGRTLNDGVGALSINGGIGVALVIVLSHASVDGRRSTARDNSPDTRVDVSVVANLGVSANGFDDSCSAWVSNLPALTRAAVASGAGGCDTPLNAAGLRFAALSSVPGGRTVVA